MPDRIQNVIDNLLDEAVKAASQSKWAEVARICSEVTNLDADNSEAARLLEAAEANLQQVIELPTVEPTLAAETAVKESFIPLEDRATKARIAIVLTVAALIISIFASINEIFFINELNKEYGFPWPNRPDAMERYNQQWFSWTPLLFLAAFLSSVVTFLIWLQTASKNLPVLEVTDQKFTPGWVVGWWFVPLWCFFKPYQILREVWCGSANEITWYAGIARQMVWPWLGWFWGAHLTANFLGNITIRLLTKNTGDSMLSASYVAILSDVILICAGLILYKFIELVTIRQSDTYKETGK